MAANSPLANRRTLKASKPRPASAWFPSATTTSLNAALAAAHDSPMKGIARDEQQNPFLQYSYSPPPKMSFGKHKLSPSPSPRHRDYDFELSSPCPTASLTPRKSIASLNSSSPIPDSPTSRYMAANTAAKLRLQDDDSPIRHVPGHSNSLAAARSLKNRDDLFSPKMRDTTRSQTSTSLFLDESPTSPFFPIRTSQSQDASQWKIPRSSNNSSRIPRMSASHSLRARASNSGVLAQKKTISMGDMQADKIDDSPFGTAFLHGRKARASMGSTTNRTRRSEMSRSVGHKSGLSLSLSAGLRPMPEFAASNSSISSVSSNGMSSTFSTDNLFDNVKPNQEAFEDASFGVKSKFKARDSTGSNASSTSDVKLMPPPSVLRPTVAIPGSAIKRARSLGQRAPLVTPDEPLGGDMSSRFDFEGQSFSFASMHEDKHAMPGTPVKRNNQYRRVVTSISQPVLGSGSDHSPADFSLTRPPPTEVIPGSVRRIPPGVVPHLMLTATSSPESGLDNSPTNYLGSAKRTPAADPNRLHLLRSAATGSSSVDCSEDEATPTKGRGERLFLRCKLQYVYQCSHPATMPASPTPKTAGLPSSYSQESMVPRLSLPAFGAQKSHRVRHRQSHPAAPPVLPDEEDIFDSRFVPIEPLGKGAFSTVLLVKERSTDLRFAVKKTRNFFDGVKDRLRHLEEIDILRHLSQTPNAHVVHFVDAWEQNRQLYIQTEACVGSLAQFLEIFGHDNLRLDEGRVWKMARDVSDGLNHIHSHGVIHFDIKTANILVAHDRSLKIADFGLATRSPRVTPQEIIAGSGLGGTIGAYEGSNKLEREGDRIYMPPEMLEGVFVKAADIYSLGIVILELALNVYLPDGGVHWRALRENNYSYVDMSTLSAPLADFIMNCMQADPNRRPTIEQVVAHPILQRVAAIGGPALAPEDDSWLAGILAESGYTLPPATESVPLSTPAVDREGDIVMD
jgi:mitosis inhibitor protein kinase SWE1